MALAIPGTARHKQELFAKRVRIERARIAAQFVPYRRSPLRGVVKWQRRAGRNIKRIPGPFRIVALLIALLFCVGLGWRGTIILIGLWASPTLLDRRIMSRHRKTHLASITPNLATISDDIIVNWFRCWGIAGAYNPKTLKGDTASGERKIPIPLPIGQRSRPDGREIMVEFPEGFDVAAAKAIEARLASAFGVRNVVIHPSKRIRTRAQMRFVERDPVEKLPKAVPWRYASNLARVGNFDDGIVLGQDFDGNDIVIKFSETPHILHGGNTGAGKSSMLLVLIGSLFRCRHTNLRFIDGKGGAELGLFKAQAEQFARTPEQALTVLTSTADEVRARYDSLYRLQDEIKLRIKRGANLEIPARLPVDATHPAIVLVFDEFTEVFAQLSKQKEDKEDERAPRREAEVAWQTILNQGRAVNVHMIAATQRASAKVMDLDGYRTNFGVTIGGLCRTAGDYIALFGQGHGWTEEQIDYLKRHRGVRLVTINGTNRLVVTEFIDDKLRGKLVTAFPDFEKPAPVTSTRRIVEEPVPEIIDLGDGRYGSVPEVSAETVESAITEVSDSETIDSSNTEAATSFNSARGPVGGLSADSVGREPLSVDLAKVFGVVAANPGLKTAAYGDLLGVHRETAGKYLQDLETRGWIRQGVAWKWELTASEGGK